MSPHAEPTTDSSTNGTHTNGKMSGEKIVNGDQAHSQFINHLTSYPVVSDSITTYKQNPYGAKSISLAEVAYTRFNSTIYQPLSPYFSTPLSFVAPYLQKADSLGDSGLSNLESRFPIVKEDTAVLKEKITGYAGYPIVFASEKKDTLLKIYGEEYNKYQENGYKNRILTNTRALIDTELRLALGALQLFESWLIQFNKTMSAKAQEVKQRANN